VNCESITISVIVEPTMTFGTKNAQYIYCNCTWLLSWHIYFFMYYLMFNKVEWKEADVGVEESAIKNIEISISLLQGVAKSLEFS
jgi:hypothetical protein